MEHGSEDVSQARSTSARTASLLGEIAAVLRVDPAIFFDGTMRERVGQNLAADELAELLALFRSVDTPDLREAAHDLIRTLKRNEDGDS